MKFPSLSLTRLSARAVAAWLLLLPAPLPAAEWEKLPPLPEPNGGFVCAAVGYGIVIAGGTNWTGGVKNWLDSVHTFSTSGLSWRTAPEKVQVAYAVSGVVESGPNSGSLLIAGGTSGTAPLRQISIAYPHPVRLMEEPRLTAVLAAGGLIGSHLILVGGTDDAANLAGFHHHALAVNLESRAVEALPDYPGKPFGTAASVAIGGQLFVFGGASWTGKDQEVVNTTAAFALGWPNKIWRRLRALPWAVRGMAAVALDANHLYLAGGFKSEAEGFTADALIYEIPSDEYRAAPALPYRAMVALIAEGDYIYCLGGEDIARSRTDAFFRIPVAALLKTFGSTSPLPPRPSSR